MLVGLPSLPVEVLVLAYAALWVLTLIAVVAGAIAYVMDARDRKRAMQRLVIVMASATAVSVHAQAVQDYCALLEYHSAAWWLGGCWGIW